MPNVLLVLVQTSVGLIEMFWVARLGTDALAGVSLVFPIVMLMQMMSGGAVGGGISSSVARAIGGGRIHETAALVHHALAIAFLLGLVSAAVVLPFGPSIYRSMGASGASLGAALAYSNIVFGGIVLLWVLNALASLLRGSGNIAYPAAVICIGALILAAISPVLIYGLGPFPRLGVAGAALAVVLYYAVGVVVLAARLASGRELVRLTLRGVHFQPEPFADILKVGAVSVLIASSMTLIVAVTNAVIGRAGPATLAGYGAASRLEYLALSLTFGLGVPVVAMVGTCIGAADRRRARRIAWLGAAIGGGVAELIGVGSALWPEAWIRLFTEDTDVLLAGSQYLHTAGPAFGFIGVGMLLYFASQGAGCMLWPAVAAVMRVLLVAGTGCASLAWGAPSIRITYLAVAAAMAVFGGINAFAVTTWPR
jgi:putative MATE family efflux protein